MSNLFEQTYNPDVLSCLANLSNDEVFTPPEFANRVLDDLPEELWHDPNATFLDPACKSGIFLREIAKRLIDGLADEFPDLEERLEHIYHKQIFGIAVTELTSLLSRRSLYCSKYPTSRYSVVHFDNPEGNVRYRKVSHVWHDGRCKYCGAPQKEFEREQTLEQYAYEFIHLDKPSEVLPMKFDVIVGNPPYQMKVNEAGKGLGAVPLYQKFVEQAIKLNPRYLTMIIPARWFSGGVGLNDFRSRMLADRRLAKITDYIDSNDCFPGVDVNGGICYFLWERDYNGDCEFTSINNGVTTTAMRRLNEYDVFIRRNEALSIIEKVQAQKEKTLAEDGGCSPQTPYGLLSTFRGPTKPTKADDLRVLSSKGWMYVARSEVTKSRDTVDLYKPMISKLSCEHAGNPDKNGQYRVLSRMELLSPGEICTQSYLTVCPTADADEARNIYAYLQTKFVRFLMLQTLAGMNISINNFKFVPWLDFSRKWTDDDLAVRYGFTEEDRAYIDSLIRPMDQVGGSNA
jgi:hypothetical protein